MVSQPCAMAAFHVRFGSHFQNSSRVPARSVDPSTADMGRLHREGRETSPGTWLNDPALRRRKEINGGPPPGNSRRIGLAMAAGKVRSRFVEAPRLRYAWNLVKGSRVIPKLAGIGP